jgi:hypothetical protein
MSHHQLREPSEKQKQEWEQWWRTMGNVPPHTLSVSRFTRLRAAVWWLGLLTLSVKGHKPAEILLEYIGVPEDALTSEDRLRTWLEEEFTPIVAGYPHE